MGGEQAGISKSNLSTPETSFKTDSFKTVTSTTNSGSNSMAQKLENFRKMSQSISAQDDLDVDDDEYTPHFQRVYITGEDNTGVSGFYKDILEKKFSHQMFLVMEY